MSNEFYNPSGAPSTGALAQSATMRAEFALVQTGFALLPTMSGNGLKVVRVNASASALEAVAVTGTGSVVMSTSPTIASPTLTTPTLGVATATTVNKVTLTAPATGSTLTVADGKTLTASNTLTLTGTDGITVAFGGGLSITAGKTLAASNTLTLSGTDGTSLNINAVATLNAGTYTPTLTGTSNVNSGTVSLARWLRVGNTVTVAGQVILSQPTGGSASWTLSLPVATTSHDNASRISGAAIGLTPGLGAFAVCVISDLSSSVANFQYFGNNGATPTVSYTFSYEVN